MRLHPSDGVVIPSSNLEDWSTSADGPWKPYTQEPEYPETEDVSRDLDTIGEVCD